MLERKIESEVFPWCKENRVGILAYSPMHSGLLTGKVSQEWFDGLPMNDWRKHKVDHPVVSPLQSVEGLSSFMTFQSELESIAREFGRTIGELATAWVLRKQEVTSAIVGARKKGQISEICQVTESPLSKDEETLGLPNEFQGGGSYYIWTDEERGLDHAWYFGLGQKENYFNLKDLADLEQGVKMVRSSNTP